MIRIRGGHSFREAAGSIDDVLSRLVEIGATEAPLTDRASTFGFYRWSKAAKKAGLRPIFGVELAVTRSLNEKKPTFDHVTFVAKDNLAPINRLVELATSQFRYRPLLTDVQAYAADGVYRILGHRAQIADLDPPPDTFLALGPSTPLGLARLAIERGIPLIASSDNRYPRESDRGFYEVLTGRNAETQTYPQHILSEEEWLASVHGLKLTTGDVSDALRTADTVRRGSTADLTRAVLVAPPRPATLREMCVRGAADLGCDLTRPDYAARLDRELALIADKAFEDYFYLVADLCQWARARMIVGPARGSSCGSLVCYLLKITTVDPIPYGLIFERFIDVNRFDMPDVDIDFSDQQRDLVFEYLRNTYGPERVARLGTVAMFKPRSALQECGAALRVGRYKTEPVADSLIVRPAGDARALDTLADTLDTTSVGRDLMRTNPEMRIATRFEGHPRHAGIHAAGVVISEQPIIETVAIDRRTGATMCDKKDAEDGYGLLKIDALGLTQLSVFEDALELAGLPRDTLEKLPLDDPAAFEILNARRWSGIFQFNGGALQGITKQFTATCFNDIVTVTALARPGPMQSGGAQEWVYRRTGAKAVTYPHPLLEGLLKDTLGILVFQEQIMTIGREIGGMSWEDVTALRKMMSKTMGREALSRFEIPWKAGALERGLDQETADKVWTDLVNFGSYGFNQCLDGDTLIENANANGSLGKYVKISDLYEKYEANPTVSVKAQGRKPVLVSLFGDEGRRQKALRIHKNGLRECYRYEFDDGSKVVCTAEHKFIINGKWEIAGASKIGDHWTALKSVKRKWYVPTGEGSGHAKGKKWGETVFGDRTGEGNPAWKNGATAAVNAFKIRNRDNPCVDCGAKNPRMEAHHEDFAHGKERPYDLTWLCVGCHKKRHYANGRTKKDEIPQVTTTKTLVSVTPVGMRETYDIEMPHEHNFKLANGIVTHNSHSVAYGIVSYWCLWLKAYHPFEFAAATLSHEPDPDKQIKILREMSTEGYDYVPIDPELSGEKWTVGAKDGRRVLVGPLSVVKGIGPKMISTIIGARARGERLTDRARKLLTEPKTAIDSLWPIRDAFARVMPDPRERNIRTEPVPIVTIQPDGSDAQVMVFCVLAKINPGDENDPAKVERRGGRVFEGPTTSLGLFLQDDTDTIFAKIGRYDFETMGKPVIERGKGLRSLYAVKGTVWGSDDFRMINVKAIRYIGDVGEDVALAPTSA